MASISPRRAPAGRAAPAAARLALAGALMLSACGGGGTGGGDAMTPPPVSPIAAPPAGLVSAASPVVAGCGAAAGSTLYRGAEVEPFAVVPATAPNRLLAAWQQDRYADGGSLALVSALSDDGGQTWQRVLQPMSRCGGAAAGSSGDYGRSSDPWVDAGPDGTLHLLGLSFNVATNSVNGASAMLASRSTDGGRSWSAPATLIRDGADAFDDKGTLTADPTDARYVYAVWDRTDATGVGPAMLARSVDGGVSWEAARPIVLPTGNGVSQTLGNRIVVLPGGAERGLLVNVFTQIDSVPGVPETVRIGVVRSADHGATWSAPVYAAEMRSVGTRDSATGHAVRDGSDLVTVAAGPDGGLWVAWQDARFSGGVRDAIALARSADGGRSWSAPVAVNRVATAAAFTPALHVRADGLVGLLHYDLRNDTADPAMLLADAWLLSSRDGASWTETHIAGPFDLALASDSGGWFLGDYQGLTSSGSTFLPVLVLSYGAAGNRSDVYAPRTVVAAAGATASTFGARPAPGGVPSPAFEAARQSALQVVLARRAAARALRLGTLQAPGRTP